MAERAWYLRPTRRRRSFGDAGRLKGTRVLPIERMKIDVELCGQLLIMNRREKHLQNMINCMEVCFPLDLSPYPCLVLTLTFPPVATMLHLDGNELDPPRRIPRAQPKALSLPRPRKRHKRGRVDQTQSGFDGSGDESLPIRVWAISSRVPLEDCFASPTEDVRAQGKGVRNW